VVRKTLPIFQFNQLKYEKASMNWRYASQEEVNFITC